MLGAQRVTGLIRPRFHPRPLLFSAFLAAGALGAALPAAAQSTLCDMSQYKGNSVGAQATAQDLTVTWTGEPGNDLRLRFTIANGIPTIEELALRRGQGAWTTLAHKLTPEFTVVTGVRRISNQQLDPMIALHMPLNKETVGKYRWEPFWDAPLDLSKPAADGGGLAGEKPPNAGIPEAGQPGLPRDPSEIQHAAAAFHVTSCQAVTDGDRLTVEFPGVDLGVFSGFLRFTVFRGTNLIRQEVVARTTKDWVAYKYDAGLKGLAIGNAARVVWRDTANEWQEDHLNGDPAAAPVALRAANRLVAIQQAGSAIAAFPPPHKFFWSREAAVNVGYSWFRKDSATTFSFGIRQSEHEDLDHPTYQGNWALYSARPGTDQLMTMFLYPTLGDATEALNKSLVFTNGDHYKPLPGFQVMNHHYHMDIGNRLIREGGPETKLPDLMVLKALGLNIVSAIDSVLLPSYTGSGEPITPKDPAAFLKRREAQNAKDLAMMAMTARAVGIHSDGGFLVLPSQEIFNGPLGGHTDLIFSHPVLWDERMPGQPLKEVTPQGTVYHIGGADDLMAMVHAENVLISMPHPRSKGSTGFPDAIKDRAYFSDPHYLGFGARWGMGLDGSETRLCEYRCWPLLDDISNWMVEKGAPLKRVISISEAMTVSPGDDVYGSAPVTYLQLAQLPPPADMTPLISALEHNYSFWSTGEVLVPKFDVQGKGNRAKVVADVTWTFPLNFVEVVWGDGKSSGRQIVHASDLPAFGSHHFEVPFDARGKKWVRFAAWDIASDGAVVQPVKIEP